MTPAQSAIAAWRADPVLFVRECLRAEPDAWQAEVLQAVVSNNRIALKASKGPGKSTVLAWIGWWFLVVYPHPKAIATSVTGANLATNLWTELAKWQGKSDFLKAAFSFNSERIAANDHPATWFMDARSWPKDADKTKQADALAGIHGDYVLGLLDEAGGIPDAVAATAEGMLANAEPGSGHVAKLVIAGNPTQLDGPLYRACTSEAALWWVKEISGDPDDPHRAPRVSIQWAREQIEKYGREHPWVLVNVFGQFPPTQSNKLLGPDDVQAAMQRTLDRAAYMDLPKVLGIDVARQGHNRTVFFLRQGLVAFVPQVLRERNLMVVASQAAAVIDKHHPAAVFVDATGIGAGVADRLRQLHYNVIDVHNASTSSQPKRYRNLRAQIWDASADWVKGGGCLPKDPELKAEATAPIFWYDGQNRMCLESKDDLEERGVPSPDKWDAFTLTFAYPVAITSANEHLQAQLAAKRRAAQAAEGFTPFDYDPFERRD